jgi:hypothetical protein
METVVHLYEKLSLTAALRHLLAASACYFIFRCIYNLYLHPLRHIPGPRVAAAWAGYEFYYDVVRDGSYLWEIREMHARYGEAMSL